MLDRTLLLSKNQELKYDSYTLYRNIVVHNHISQNLPYLMWQPVIHNLTCETCNYDMENLLIMQNVKLSHVLNVDGQVNMHILFVFLFPVLLLFYVINHNIQLRHSSLGQNMKVVNMILHLSHVVTEIVTNFARVQMFV